MLALTDGLLVWKRFELGRCEQVYRSQQCSALFVMYVLTVMLAHTMTCHDTSRISARVLQALEGSVDGSTDLASLCVWFDALGPEATHLLTSPD